MTDELTIKRVENGYYVMLGNYNSCRCPKRYCAVDVPGLYKLIEELADTLDVESEKENYK